MSCSLHFMPSFVLSRQNVLPIMSGWRGIMYSSSCFNVFKCAMTAAGTFNDAVALCAFSSLWYAISYHHPWPLPAGCAGVTDQSQSLTILPPPFPTVNFRAPEANNKAASIGVPFTAAIRSPICFCVGIIDPCLFGCGNDSLYTLFLQYNLITADNNPDAFLTLFGLCPAAYSLIADCCFSCVKSSSGRPMMDVYAHLFNALYPWIVDGESTFDFAFI